MDKIVSIQNLDPTTLELQTYSSDDQNLISSFDLETNFSSSDDNIEYSVYDLNQNLLLYINNFLNYSILNNKLQLDPQTDLESYGFEEGQYITNYNFFKNILGSTNDNTYFISEISSDRTEIRLDTTLIPNDIVITQTNDYKIQLEQSQYYKDFYLNFGNNDLIIANNVLLDTSNPDNPTVLIKLYEPLPPQFSLKSELWVVETISEPLTYQISLTMIFSDLDDNIQLQGPNFNIPIKDRVNNSTEFASLNSIKSTTSTYGSSSLQYQLNSILDEKGFEINIDYSEYSNFIFFSSAKTRLENFYYKMSLIEEYNTQSTSNITGSASSSYYVSSSFDIYQAKINDIITKFDGYEYFLYFDSGSGTWPKVNSDKPYVNLPTTSPIVTTWLTEQYASASDYDTNLNPNNLINTIPTYLRDDSNNDQYSLFVEMIGQHFDSIWVYIKDITNKYNADNRLDYGISKDLVSDVLRDLGIKIYQNNFSTDDLYTSFIGITPGGSLLPSTGNEVITNYVSASLDAYVLPGYIIVGYVNGQPITVPLSDVNASIYKRIYHNVPYLLKKKGTVEGLRALITLYGIPDTILRINEFGGKNKDNSNDWDQWQNQYNNALNISYNESYPVTSPGPFYGSGTYGTSVYGDESYNSGTIIIPWDRLSITDTYPESIAFRFKTPGVPTTLLSQSLIETQTVFDGDNFNLVLEYTGSDIPGIYSGSTTSSYYDYGVLKLIIPDTQTSCSVYLPFFNEDWWSVLITKSGNNYNLYAKNKLNTGNDGNQIGFQSSSSLTASNPNWNIAGKLYLGGLIPNSTSSLVLNQQYLPFTGSLQEFRYYNIVLNETSFDDFVMNPYSIEGNSESGINSSYNTLKFRAPLGSLLDNTYDTVKTSYHPSVSGPIPTASFQDGTSTYIITGSVVYTPNTEVIFLDQFPAGIRNAINNKIKISDSILPNGDTLSPYIRIQQNASISGSYTKDINLLEVAFSPQNEINQDIISQLGYFNLGDYIGDPRQLATSNTSYPDLNALRDEYFKKYNHNYNLTDYIRLIKYFDNSLFKMIKDFVPARTSLSSGIVIKQHLLERNKYRVPSSSYSEPYYTASVKSFPFDFESSQLYKTSGGGAGEFNSVYINELTQSWSESIVTPLGIVTQIHSDKSEFLTGELSGSTIVATTQSLGPIPQPFTLELVDTVYVDNPFPNPYPIIPYTFNTDKKYYLQYSTYNSNISTDILIFLVWNGTLTPITNEFGFAYSGSSYTSSLISLPNIISPQIMILTSDINQSFTASIYEVLNTQYNPLLNNVSSSRTSTRAEDVDYSSGQSIPVNQQLLISGTATPAQVQDYNWNVRRSTLPRYEGSRLTGANINVHTAGDKSYGKEPVINNYQTSFLTFKEIRGAYPELVGKSTLWINSLVDKDGNQLAVDFNTGSTYYYNLIDNFGKDSQVDLQITTIPTGSSSTDLDLSTTVYQPALLWPKVVLTNESGSKLLNNNTISYTTASIAINATLLSNGFTFPLTSLSSSVWGSAGPTLLNIITSSYQLYNTFLTAISLTSYSFNQNNTTTSSVGGVGGYDPITLDLTRIKVGNEIRFNQDESRAYIIKEVNLNSTLNYVWLVLDRPIPSSHTSSLNDGFLIREYQVDPSKLVINAPKLVGGAPGYLTPRYMSPELVASLDKTVETLKENGIL